MGGKWNWVAGFMYLKEIINFWLKILNQSALVVKSYLEIIDFNLNQRAVSLFSLNILSSL
jgi:hypothetical protein